MAKTQTQTLNQQFLNSYRRQLDAQGDAAAAYFAKSIDAYSRANPNASTAEFRDFTIDLFGVALPNFTDLSATLSCELFDTLAESVGFEGERARTYDDTDYEQVAEKVRYMARHLNGGDVDAFKREVTDITKYYVKRSAFENMRRNCEGQKVKWARVPSGLETCGFCFMLSSRGFVYSSERTARDGRHGYHRNCDCIAIPGFQKNGNPLVRIEGYNPKGMADRWTMCARTAGIRKGGDVVTGSWTDEELKIVQREAETRDPHWLYTGETPKVDTSAIDLSRLNENQKRVYKKELNCARVLSDNGFRTSLIDDPNVKSAPGVPKFDYAIGAADVLWEAKCPEGNGYLAVAGNIAKADTKFRKAGSRSRIVLSNLDSAMNDGRFLKHFEESLSDPESDYSNVQKILFVLKDGSVTRWENK